MFVFRIKRQCTHFVKSILESQMFNSNLFVCVEVVWPSQPNGVMSSAVSLLNHTCIG